MSLRLIRSLRLLVLGALAVGATAPALAHSGHDAPAVHAHTGSPALLAFIAILLVGTAGAAVAVRLLLRRRRLARSRG
ncbi:hypothetical protein SAMN04487957_11113 [Halomonas shengliensis]|uniref:Uncharacterized protein n=1 Tax=Halomonas shengliensis TaxID=419597 RepID=A0A1H0M316_9GAMM|nr:hypothetical protein [Halomonas shengliensis]SDO74839.1 hypothetical protein SAMN04487957_11113 [Halomonas shengliensis]